MKFPTQWLPLLALVALAACRPMTGDGDAGAHPADADAGPDETSRSPIPVGEPCERANSCVDDARCIGNAGEGFTCMATCSADRTWKLCDDGSVCTPVQSGAPVCYTGGDLGRSRTCEDNLECRSGLLCFGVDQRTHYCLPACHDDGIGCADDEVCRTVASGGKGLCRDEIGASCGRGDSCSEDLTCSDTLGSALRGYFPGGYCTRTGCESDEDCPAGGVCRNLPSLDRSLCFDSCKTEADCRLTSDYTCLRESDCDEAGEPESCRDFRDGDRFCVPTSLGSWDAE